ncbi:MAG: alkaline phosphatase family protein [Phycisphaerales bacterium]
MTSRPVQRLLILGWDAADWQVIDPLLSRGRMPNLARLLSAGTRADLRTLEPKLSPLLWSTIATGKTADRHGILNFVEPSPAGDGVRADGDAMRMSQPETSADDEVGPVLRLLSET